MLCVKFRKHKVNNQEPALLWEVILSLGDRGDMIQSRAVYQATTASWEDPISIQPFLILTAGHPEAERGSGLFS